MTILNKPVSNLSSAFNDIRSGFSQWRIWYTLGFSDIRQKYSRSKIGQFWITISTAIFIGAIGTVNSILFQQDIHTFLPFLATNIICWYFISGIINDGNIAFIQSEGYLKQIALPKSIFVLRILIRNIINFAHNLVILPVIFLIYPPPLSFYYFLAPVGLFLNLIAGFLVVIILGLLCTRFRDTPPIVNNFVQLAFFITPILWPVEALRSKLMNFGIYNPFAAFLNVMSEPMRGVLPLTSSYIVVFICIVLLACLAIPLFVKYRARITYWL